MLKIALILPGSSFSTVINYLFWKFFLPRIVAVFITHEYSYTQTQNATRYFLNPMIYKMYINRRKYYIKFSYISCGQENTTYHDLST